MAADRTNPGTVAVKTVYTARDMHKPVFPAVKGREGPGFYQFAPVKFCRTDRTGLGIPGKAFAPDFALLSPAVSSAPAGSFKAYAEKEGIPEPEQGAGGNGK
jgi:hypothetical protein